MTSTKRVGIAGEFLGGVAVAHLEIGTLLAAGGIRHGIVGLDAGAHLDQALGDVQGGRIAQVVRIGFEREAKQADGAAFEDEELFLKLLDHHLALGGVDVERGLEEFAGVAVLAGGMQQRLNVLAEATSAPADAGVEELGADAGIQTDAGHDFGTLGADALADVGDLVGEADFHGEERVGGVLDHLGAGEGSGQQRHGDHGRRTRNARRGREDLGHQGLVEFAHDREGCGVAADHDAVGVERIGDGGAFAQELRIAGHAEADAVVAALVAEAFAHQGLDQVAGADGHRRFVDDHAKFRAIHGGADTLGGRFEVSEVGFAGRQRRSADGDEDDVASAARRQPVRW